MNREERLRNTIAGVATDKTPYAFWTHFPEIDTVPEKIAEKTIRFYENYRFDFVKTMNNGFYTAEAFGCSIDSSDVLTGGVAKITDSPVKSVNDLFNLGTFSFDETVSIRELYHLNLVLSGLKKSCQFDDGGVPPVLFTTFTPLTTLDKICGTRTIYIDDDGVEHDEEKVVQGSVKIENFKKEKKSRLIEYMEQGENAAAIHYALNAISLWTESLVEKAIDEGAAGIFLASQMSSYNKCTYEQYMEFGKTYDQRVLKAAAKGWMNTIHCHGDRIMFDILRDYDVQIFNWHAWETLPEIDEAYAFTKKCLMGGISRSDITFGNKEALQNQIYHSIKIMGGKHLILTPGCVIRYPLNETAMRFVNCIRNEVDLMVRT